MHSLGGLATVPSLRAGGNNSFEQNGMSNQYLFDYSEWNLRDFDRSYNFQPVAVPSDRKAKLNFKNAYDSINRNVILYVVRLIDTLVVFATVIFFRVKKKISVHKRHRAMKHSYSAALGFLGERRRGIEEKNTRAPLPIESKSNRDRFAELASRESLKAYQPFLPVSSRFFLYTTGWRRGRGSAALSRVSRLCMQWIPYKCISMYTGNIGDDSTIGSLSSRVTEF